MIEFWSSILAELESGQDAFLALVGHHSRHSPGSRGARLWISADGKTHGTIGGGIMEHTVIMRATRALADENFAPQVQTLHHRKETEGDRSGLICAGHQTNVYYLCRADRDRELVAQIVARLEADESGLLEISPAGMRLGDETPDAKAAPIILQEPSAPDATDWRYREQLLNWKRVAIIGGGHCGLALSRVMADLGYVVTICETRPEVFTFRDNPHPRHRLVVDDYVEAGPLLDHPEFTHVVVMTADYPSDVRGLLGTLNLPFPYVGVMGAPAKLARIYGDLRELGIDDVAIDRIYAPIGLPMTSNTPAEIAISVAAQILQEREVLFPHTRPAQPELAR